MRHTCPQCKRVCNHAEIRYIDGRFREVLNVNHSKIYRFECKAKPCKHAFMVRIDFPKDEQGIGLQPVEWLFYEWGEFRTAQKSPPGKEYLGSTASQYTLFIKQNPANIYQRVIQRYTAAKKKTLAA